MFKIGDPFKTKSQNSKTPNYGFQSLHGSVRVKSKFDAGSQVD